MQTTHAGLDHPAGPHALERDGAYSPRNGNHHPRGFEGFFDDLGALPGTGTPPAAAALNEIGERHATCFRMDWVPEPTHTYGGRLLGS